MPKQLKDILNGVKKSKITPEKLGDRPHVDYEPKAPAEKDWVAKHSVEKHDDRVGNGDDVYQATNVKKVSNKKTNKGHDKGEDEKVYEAKEVEDAKCNHTPKGKECPVHGMMECMSAKKINELGPSTLASYTKKATGDISKRFMNLGQMSVHARKMSVNPDNFMKAQEIVKATDAEYNKLGKRFAGVHKATDKLASMAKEEIKLDELGPSTLASYTKKAISDVANRSMSLGQKSANPFSSNKAKEVEYKKLRNRFTGVNRASNKLAIMAKEEVELDEVSKDTLQRYRHLAKSERMDPIKGTQRKAGMDLALKKIYGSDEFGNKPKVKATKEEVELDEILTKQTSAGEVIKDFQQSKNPKFAGKSKEKRKQMALAAYYAKQRETNEDLSNDDFHKDMADVKAGKADASKMADKWGPRGGAFLGFIKSKSVKEDLAMPLLGGDHSDLPKGRADDTQEEIEMVKAELKALANKALHILMAMPQDLHVEPWVQAKIAQAKEMINSVHDYMVYGDHDQPEDEQTDTPMTFPGMNVDNALGMNV